MTNYWTTFRLSFTSFVEYEIGNLIDYCDGTLVVDSDNYKKTIPLINSETDIKNINLYDQKPLFIYVISGKGKTGSFKNLPTDYISTIKKLKKITDIDCFVGFGIKDLEDIKIVIENGADGAIIGSKFMSLVKDLDKVVTYIEEITG